MSKLMTIVSALKGKKTYIVSALMIILGLIQGDNKMLLDGIGFMFLRNAIPAPQPEILP